MAMAPPCGFQTWRACIQAGASGLKEVYHGQKGVSIQQHIIPLIQYRAVMVKTKGIVPGRAFRLFDNGGCPKDQDNPNGLLPESKVLSGKISPFFVSFQYNSTL